VDEAEYPGDEHEPVDDRVARPADPVTRVEGQGDGGRRPAGDDSERGPQRLVGGDERDGDVGEVGVQERVAEQQQPVCGDGDERRQREHLVVGAAFAGRSLLHRTGHEQAIADRRG
jgi:hypothetical protein